MNRTCGLRATSETFTIARVQADVAQAVAREIQIKLTPHERRRLDGDKTRVDQFAGVTSCIFGAAISGTGVRKRVYARALSASRKHCGTIQASRPPTTGSPTPIRCSACRGMTPALESFHKAKTAARQAVRLQPELGEGYASLAHVLRLHDWDWVGWRVISGKRWNSIPDIHRTLWYAEYLMAMAGPGKRS